MLKSKLIIILFLLLVFAAYFLGRQNGSTQVKQTVINNIEMVKEITELSSLSVTGSTTVKLTNINDKNSWFGKVKNYLTENTLQVTIPYEAKYGITLGDSTIKYDLSNNILTLKFPSTKLLSLQLQLDKLQTMNQTGVFNSTTISDLANAQKQLYQEAITNLSNNKEYLTKSQELIKKTLTKYYSPLGIQVNCTFDK